MRYFLSLILGLAIIIPNNATTSSIISDEDFSTTTSYSYIFTETSSVNGDEEAPTANFSTTFDSLNDDPSYINNMSSKKWNKLDKTLLKIGGGFFAASGLLVSGYCVYSWINGTPVFPWNQDSTESLLEIVPLIDGCQKTIATCAQNLYEMPEVFVNAVDVGMKLASAVFAECMESSTEFCQSIPNTASICLGNVPWVDWDFLRWNSSMGIENIGRIGEVIHCQFFNGVGSCVQALSGLGGQVTNFIPDPSLLAEISNICNTENAVHQIFKVNVTNVTGF